MTFQGITHNLKLVKMVLNSKHNHLKKMMLISKKIIHNELYLFQRILYMIEALYHS